VYDVDVTRCQAIQ